LEFQKRFSDKIVEEIKKNARFQYERSLATRSIAIFIALTAKRRDNAGGNDVAIFSRMKK
jgi:hypothetical protein